MENENMTFYEMGREVPKEALKDITAGRLKGFTDVNPMWRIKKLTEMFGPAGIGWWTENVQKETVYDEITKQKSVFLSLDLRFIDPISGETSHPIHGEGGASMLAQERNGPYFSDECYKMAYTDALSVACKALGIGANVYFALDTAEGKRKPIKPSNQTKYGAERGPLNVPKSTVIIPETVKATPKQIEFLAGRYKGAVLQRLLEANGLTKIEDMSIEKASELIQKIKETDERKSEEATA